MILAQNYIFERKKFCPKEYILKRVEIAIESMRSSYQSFHEKKVSLRFASEFIAFTEI